MVKTFGLLVLLTLSPVFPQDLPPLPAETLVLIEEARTVAPEFSSDILLRLAGSRVIADPAWKRQLIEEAFSAGAHAQLPYRKEGEEATDARASRAYWNNGLESLTLQTRAVEAMLELDSQRARAMFEEIPTPQVPALTCQETGAPILSGYYQTAGRIVEKGFTSEQRKELQHMHFLKRVIGQMQSPAHVTPAVKLIFTVAVTPEERQELVFDFAAMLPRINGSARVFGAATFQLVPVSAPVRLPPGVNAAPALLDAAPGQLPPQVVAAAPVLLPALRSYILRHVSGPRCSENIRARQAPSVVNDFNYLASALDPGALSYKPISQDEARPAKDAGTYERHFWWQSDRSKQVLDALKWLNHGNRNLPDASRFFTPEERATVEWNTHFIETLRLIEGWKASEESSSEDWFGMVSEAYGSLGEKAPPGQQREAVMARYLNFMETHYAIVASHNLWFTQLKGRWRSNDTWIVEELANSANPVISLYARMNKRIAEFTK
jgi:hypothetical protein